ncbi:unnamed protein product [Phytophthora fragariaefolia]|uniref:Unnamed protein product n=1 Tax=Phytophthora fragariaefolia TaxID=1490495 RepID=A0A9W6TWY6_9STRA|nr:unnamed protein product [Phytophthora fragariaefolia]
MFLIWRFATVATSESDCGLLASLPADHDHVESPDWQVVKDGVRKRRQRRYKVGSILKRKVGERRTTKYYCAACSKSDKARYHYPGNSMTCFQIWHHKWESEKNVLVCGVEEASKPELLEPEWRRSVSMATPLRKRWALKKTTIANFRSWTKSALLEQLHLFQRIYFKVRFRTLAAWTNPLDLELTTSDATHKKIEVLAQMRVYATKGELKFMIAAMLVMGIPLLQAARHMLRYVCTKWVVENPPLTPRTFTLDDIDPTTCRRRFRFLPDEIEQLDEALKLPPFITTAQGCHVPRQEALCLLLRRLAYPCRLKNLEEAFGRRDSVLSSAINLTVMLVWCSRTHKLVIPQTQQPPSKSALIGLC